MPNADAESKKEEGNELLTAGEFEKAIECYSAAIEIEPDAVYYSNRSAVYARTKRYQEAVDDGAACIEMRKDWFKAYSRHATALDLQGKPQEAIASLKKGLSEVTDDDGLQRLKDMEIKMLMKNNKKPIKKKTLDPKDTKGLDDIKGFGDIKSKAQFEDMFKKMQAEDSKSKKPKEPVQMSRIKIMICLILSMVLGHLTRRLIGQGWAICYAAVYTFGYLYISRSLADPEDVNDMGKMFGIEPQKTWFSKFRPWFNRVGWLWACKPYSADKPEPDDKPKTS